MAKRLDCVCLDNSENSEQTFNWYVENYHCFEDVVGLLHVHETPDVPLMGSMDYTMAISDAHERIITDSLEESRQLIKKFEKKCKERNLEYKILSPECYDSAPGHVICDVAKRNHANAIIMGQRGKNAISRMLLGSTSDYVVHHAHIPVTVIPIVKHK